MAYKDPEKAKAYIKKWREKNREKLNKQACARYQKNIEEEREKSRKRRAKHYAKNKDKINARAREWRTDINNQDKVNEQNQYMRDWYQNNKDKVKEDGKKYREKNRDKTNARAKKYREENKEKLNEGHKKYREKNKEKLSEYHKEYFQQNKEKQAKDNKYRYHNDPNYKLRLLVAGHIRYALKKGNKAGQSILPYVDWNSYEELKEHLESQFEPWMTWENHGAYHPTEKRWQIDHIIPQSVLLEGVTSMDDPKFRECWALENLRPLEARENLSKGSKIL